MPDISGAAVLIDFASGHYRDAVRELHGLVRIMCHHNCGCASGFESCSGCPPQLATQGGVDARKGFVEQQHARFWRHRAGEGHTLLLAAGQFMWVALIEPDKVHLRKQLRHAFVLGGLGRPGEAKCQIGGDVQMRKQHVVLKHEPDWSLFRWWLGTGFCQQLVVQRKMPTLYRLKTRSETQQGALAASRWAKQTQNLALGRFEADILQHPRFAVAMAYVVEFQTHLFRSFCVIPSEPLSSTEPRLSRRANQPAPRPALARFSGWCASLVTLLVVLLLALPMLSLLSTLIGEQSAAWPHLRATVLPEYLSNTAWLLLLVGAGTLLLGVGSAWLTSTLIFPGQRVLTVALVLPLAAPAYVIAYVYTDLLDYSGALQSRLRAWFDLAPGYYFPQLRTLPGAAIMLTLVLYPYVYLLARSAFVSQSAALFDAARVLGKGPWRAFLQVALPTARPAIVGGVALVLMETVADYGVVEYFGLATLTTGIFRTWYALGDQLAALQLAAWLFLVVLVLVLAEYFLRRGQVANPTGHLPEPRPMQLRGARAWLATIACSLPVVFGFVLPLLLLVGHALEVGDPLLGRSFSGFVLNSFTVAGSAAVIATGIAVLLGYRLRERASRKGQIVGQLAVRLAALGYALPGAVLGLALLVPLSTFDRWLATLLRDEFDIRSGLLLTGTIAALVYAYVVRFMTAAYNSVDAGLAQVSPQIDAVGRTLGATPGRLVRELHLPLLGPAVMTGSLLVFIDVLKELPATLILRPFNFETLATRTFRLASDERIAEASTAALVIVLLGLVPTLLVMRRTR